MKKILFFMVAAMFCISVSQAQTYKKVKITMKDGRVIEGVNGSITKESVVFGMKEADSNGINRQGSCNLSDVSLIQSKKGSAGKWALGCGGGCLAACIVTTIVDGGETADTGTMLLGSAIWTAVFTGVGALIGSATDKWENVYMGNLSYMNRLNLNFTTDQFTRYTPRTNNFTLTYRF